MKMAIFVIGANVPLDPAAMDLVNEISVTPAAERRAKLEAHMPLLVQLDEQSRQPGVRQPPPVCWLLAEAEAAGLNLRLQ